MDLTVVLQIEKKKLERLLKISISSYIDEINRLLGLPREDEQQDLVLKICKLVKEAEEDVKLLQTINADVPQERLDPQRRNQAIGVLYQMKELLNIGSISDYVGAEGSSFANEILSLAEQLKEALIPHCSNGREQK